MKYRLACIYCDREDFDGVSKLPNDWTFVERYQTHRQSTKTYDDPSKVPPGFVVFNWFTHLGICPKCQ